MTAAVTDQPDRPTPLVLARAARSESRHRPNLLEELVARLGPLVTLLESLELDTRTELIDWIGRRGRDEVDKFLDRQLSGFDFFARWRPKEEIGTPWFVAFTDAAGFGIGQRTRRTTDWTRIIVWSTLGLVIAAFAGAWVYLALA